MVDSISLTVFMKKRHCSLSCQATIALADFLVSEERATDRLERQLGLPREENLQCTVMRDVKEVNRSYLAYIMQAGICLDLRVFTSLNHHYLGAMSHNSEKMHFGIQHR